MSRRRFAECKPLPLEIPQRKRTSYPSIIAVVHCLAEQLEGGEVTGYGGNRQMMGIVNKPTLLSRREALLSEHQAGLVGIRDVLRARHGVLTSSAPASLLRQSCTAFHFHGRRGRNLSPSTFYLA